MNLELTKKQSEKGDKFLNKLLSEEKLVNESVYEFFGDRDEAIVICKLLEQIGLIAFKGSTDKDPFLMTVPEEELATFLKTGGLTQIASNKETERLEHIKRQSKQDELLDLDLKLKIFESKIGKKLIVAGFIITILSFLITILTLEFYPS